MKRNDIVHTKEEEKNGWILYGRIWKTLSDGRHVVICGGAHVKVLSEDELILSDYKGTVRRGRYVRMDSLKQLKKWANEYNPHFGNGRGRWSKKQTRRANELINQGIQFYDDPINQQKVVNDD